MIPRPRRPRRGDVSPTLNAPMSEIGLQRACVAAIVRKLEAAGVSQHMRVQLKRETGGDARTGNQFLKPGNTEGRATLAHEHERALDLEHVLAE